MKKWLLLVPALAWAFAMLLPYTTADAAPAARNCGGASVWVSYPQPGATVSGTFAITGAAALPPGEFQYYKVEFAAAGTDAWAVIVDRVRPAVINGTLAVVNTDVVPPGDYTIRVLAVDRTGNYCDAFSSPIHVGTAAPNTPTAPPTPTLYASPTPIMTPLPSATLASPASSQPAVQAPPGTPTLAIQIPTVSPGLDPLLTQGKGAGSLLPTLPTAELSAMGTSVMAWTGSVGRAFVFGIQLTAGAFILLGVIAFLRHNL